MKFVSVKALIASGALLASLSLTAPASATVYSFVFEEVDQTAGTVGGFTFLGNQYTTYELILPLPPTSGVLPLTIVAGDQINLSLSFSGGSGLGVPGYGYSQFFGVNPLALRDDFPGAGPVTTGSIVFANYVGAAFPGSSPTAGCQNCLSSIIGADPGTPFSFTGLTMNAVYDNFIGEAEITGFSISYQVQLTSAVPEASTWTMMIRGFAGLGVVTYRRSRQSTASSAA